MKGQGAKQRNKLLKGINFNSKPDVFMSGVLIYAGMRVLHTINSIDVLQRNYVHQPASVLLPVILLSSAKIKS